MMSSTARVLALLALLVGSACSGGGLAPPAGNAPLPTPSGISPASIAAPPMRTTPILQASAMTSRTPAAAIEPASWSQLPGAASQVAADRSGTIYALSDRPAGPDKDIWRYSSGTWTNLGGEASQLAVTPAGALYVINSLGGIYAYDSNAWTPIAGGAGSIAAAADGSLYVISNGGAGPDRPIWRYSGGTWAQIPGAGTAVVANPDASFYGVAGGRIDPGGVYVVNSAGAIFYRNGPSGFAPQTYTSLPGSATAVAPTLYGAIFALGYPHNSGGDPIYSFDFATQTWSTYPGLASSIGYGADGRLYAVAANGALYVTSAVAHPITAGVRIDTDPFTNSTGQHATEVEPSAAAVGTTIVSAFQAAASRAAAPPASSWPRHSMRATVGRHNRCPG